MTCIPGHMSQLTNPSNNIYGSELSLVLNVPLKSLDAKSYMKAIFNSVNLPQTIVY